MAETIYVEGIRTFPPREDAPDFVKGALIISINTLVKFCKENPQYLNEYKGEKQLKCQILSGKKGLYLAVDTYKTKNESSKNDDDAMPNYKDDLLF